MRSRLLLITLAFALAALVLGVRSRTAAASMIKTNPARKTESAARDRFRVVRYAKRFLGVRYVYGGTSPRTGFDCSGFVAYVYRHFGRELPHYSVAQFGLGRHIARKGLRPGDLLFFDGLGHVGIYVGKGRFIHAPHAGTSVSITRLSGWYGARYDGARRLRIATA
jgi:cell wall-associated NlpC family hydrolase